MEQGQQIRLGYMGSGQALFVLVFKNLLLTLVTLGGYLPWARTERRKFLLQNTEVDGHRFRYHGTGQEMFLGYLKVLGAYVVLFGIPAILTQIDPVTGTIAQVIGSLALLPVIPLAIYGSRRYLLGRTSLRNIRFGLERGAGGYFKEFVLGGLLTIITLGLYAPVLQNRLKKYMTEHSRFGSAAFGYDGPNGKAWTITMKGLFLTAVTLGFYYPWFAAELARFHAAHTYFQGARFRLDLSGGTMFKLLLVSAFGLLFSLGIAFPWITTYVLQTYLSRLTLEGSVDYLAIAQRDVSGDAAADGFADALDVGLEV